jgi:hypothetical protein
VRKAFLAHLGPVVAAETATRPSAPPLRTAPADDPYGF